MIGQKSGHYKILEPLGKSGTGDVYRAEHAAHRWLSPITAAVMLVAFIACHPVGASVTELREAIAQAELGGGQVPDEHRNFQLGHLALDLSAGSLHAVLGGQTVIGLFFRGQGQFRYASEDRYEKASWAVNVKRVTGFTVNSGAISGSFDTALILDSRLHQIFPSAAALPSGDPSLEMARELSRFQLRVARDRGIDAANRLAQALVEGVDRPFICAQLDTGGKDLVYQFDGLRSGEESLSVMERFRSRGDLSGARWAQEVSRQRISGDRLATRPVPFVVHHVELDLRNSADRHLELQVTETIEAMRPLRTLDFDLWSERFEKGEALDYVLRKVSLKDGTPLGFSHEKGDLVIELSPPMAAGERLEIRFEIGGDVLYRPLGHSFWWLPLASWLPLPQRLDMRSFTYHAMVRVAPPFVPFSMGRTVRRWEEDDLVGAEFELERPTQFVVVLAGKYRPYEETRDGLTIRLASYAFPQNDSMRRIANNTFELIRFYEPLLGEFPFGELTILEINSYGFGIAPPGVIYLTSEAFDPSPSGRRYRAELNMRMAHEVAHMWWAHVAQMAGFEEQWLSESTAEYYAALAVGQLLGEHKFKAAVRQWKEQAGRVRAPESIYLANRIAGEKAYLDRYGLLYAKGPLMFHALREELGDKVFLTLMKSTLTNFHFKHIETRDFIELTNFITQRDYGPWFAEHLFAME